jgi:hypothetical protein
MSTQSTLASDLKVRPNTGIPERFFQRNMIICAGEDPNELVDAMNAILLTKQIPSHEYRCYRAWMFEGLTVILSGTGTGCLEPLMWELLDSHILLDKVPKRLILIGSAGILATSGFGQVYVIDGAYPVGCAVMLDDKDLPLRPKFASLNKIPLPHAEEISTDYYYGCTPQVSDPRKVRVKASNSELRRGIEKQWKEGRLIAMETAQFYHFANTYGPPDTEYVSIQGVANLADQFETQGQYSREVLTETFRHAVELLSD